MDGKWVIKLFQLNLCLLGIYYSLDIIILLSKWYARLLKRHEVNETLFSSDRVCTNCALEENVDCSNFYCYHYTVKKMKSFLQGAQRSIYICMNVFTSHDLGLTVLRMHERGIAVKVIANQSTAYLNGSQIRMLHSNGIPVKYQRTQNYVHHKFCLVDSDVFQTNQRLELPEDARTIPSTGVVMTGSMNWTFQAMNTNFENVMITSDQFFVRQFHQEFLRIWFHDDIVQFI